MNLLIRIMKFIKHEIKMNRWNVSNPDHNKKKSDYKNKGSQFDMND